MIKVSPTLSEIEIYFFYFFPFLCKKCGTTTDRPFPAGPS